MADDRTEADLVAAEQAAAAEIGAVEDEFLTVVHEFRERKRAVRDAYLAAHAALEAYRAGRLDPDRPTTTLVPEQ